MNSMNKIYMLIADSHTYYRKAITNLINQELNMRVIAEAKNPSETILYIKNYRPDVILLDIDMNESDGFEILEHYKNTDIIPKIIIHTMGLTKETIEKLLSYDKLSIIKKESQLQYLIPCIHEVARELQFIEPGLEDIIASTTPTLSSRLTNREYEVLKSLSRGLSNLEIASSLFVSEKTVKNHLTSIFKKLAIPDRTHAAIYAINNKIV